MNIVSNNVHFEEEIQNCEIGIIAMTLNSMMIMTNFTEGVKNVVQ